MKKGNVGMVMSMLGKKMKTSFGSSTDYGLTGKDGVVHPSLEVRGQADGILQSTLCCQSILIFVLKESAKKFEQNVHLFGSTVEGLLYRYGKVTLIQTVFC